jgi:DNA-binding LacI/PurR family transcriptional regulator
MAVTIQTIAQLAKVSTATISRYLNYPESVSPKKRALIAEVIKEQSYVPNELARGLTRNIFSTIGVIMPDINNTFFSAVLLGIELELEKSGYSTLVCNTHGHIEREKRYLEMLASRRVAGIIFVGTRPLAAEDNAHIVELARKVPVMLINDRLASEDVSFVMTNEEQGMGLAVEYLYGLGHRNIGLLNGNPPFTTYRYKLDGFTGAMKRLGLEIRDGFVQSIEPYEKGGYSGMLKIGQLASRPTAVVTANDQIAIGAVRAVFESGWMVPRDMSIVGFSNTPISAEVYPRLTTVDQFPYDTGKVAAQQLMEQIDTKNTRHSGLRIDCKMMVRASCAQAAPG